MLKFMGDQGAFPGTQCVVGQGLDKVGLTRESNFCPFLPPDDSELAVKPGMGSGSQLGVSTTPFKAAFYSGALCPPRKHLYIVC